MSTDAAYPALLGRLLGRWLSAGGGGRVVMRSAGQGWSDSLFAMAALEARALGGRLRSLHCLNRIGLTLDRC